MIPQMVLDGSLPDMNINKSQRKKQHKQQMPPDAVELNRADFNTLVNKPKNAG
jgi:hypothetical protein